MRNKNIDSFFYYYTLCFLFFFITQVLKSQNMEQYFQGNNDFSILLPNNAVVSTSAINNGYTETFVIKNSDGEFKYILIVTKADSDGNEFHNLLTDDFKESYLENCSCQITESNEIEYNNMKSLQFKIIVNSKDQKFVGFSDNIISGQHLYNLVYLTTASNYATWVQEYNEIANSLLIYSD